MRAMPVGRVGLLVAALVGLGACGGNGSSSTGPTDQGQASFLFEHNAQFNAGRTIRWPTVPITVATNGIAREDEVNEWAVATGGRVSFAFVGSGPANIVVRFRRGVDICGTTTVEFNDTGVITSADVRVSESIYRGPQCVRTVTHEIGHAIGFLNHTSDGGLMDDDGGNGRISPAVAEMLVNLYTFAPNTQVAASQQLRGAPGRGGRRAMTFVYYPRR